MKNQNLLILIFVSLFVISCTQTFEEKRADLFKKNETYLFNKDFIFEDIGIIKEYIKLNHTCKYIHEFFKNK